MPPDAGPSPHALRERQYRFLARAFRDAPDAAWLERCRALRFPTGGGEPSLDEGYRQLRTYLDAMGEGAVDELAVDHARALLGAGAAKAAAAHPYASVHASRNRLLMQEARDAAVAAYARNGLRVAPGRAGEPEDHLATMLAFMAVLCRRTAEHERTGRDAEARSCLEEQRAFLEIQLLGWVPDFCAALGRQAETDYYRGFGRIALGWLRTDRDFLRTLTPTQRERPVAGGPGSS